MADGPRVPGNAQATLIASLGNNIIVYCGLLIAGFFAFLASKYDPATAPWWLNLAVIVVLLCAMLGGMLALIAVSMAHNLSRRAERLAEGQDSDSSRLEAARRHATHLSEYALYAALATTLAGGSLGVGYVIAQRRAVTDQSVHFISIQRTDDGHLQTKIKGTVRGVSVDNTPAGCRTNVSAGRVSIDILGTGDCSAAQ